MVHGKQVTVGELVRTPVFNGINREVGIENLVCQAVIGGKNQPLREEIVKLALLSLIVFVLC
jgi:hypothetical protein